MQVFLLADFLLLHFIPASFLRLPQALEFLSGLVELWKGRVWRAEAHLRLLLEAHVVVSEVVGVSLRCILAHWLQPWRQQFPSVKSESLLGCFLEDQCQPLQAWPYIS